MRKLPPQTTLIYNAHILQVRPPSCTLVKGVDMKSLPSIENGYVSISNGRITDVGPMTACPKDTGFDLGIDFKGCFLLPTWVDSHTHIVYHKSRENEFVDRIKGKSYEEIAAAGGGILNSALQLGTASEDELFNQALGRLHEVIQFGTGAIEIKSGYGLSVESELKMLRVIRRLKEVSPISIKATFLGAHAIPSKYRENRHEYLDLIIETMLPQIAESNLADYCDVFCETGFFTVEESRSILKKAAEYGLKGKIHANELDYSGGVQLGVEMECLSVDHLECIGDEEIESLKNGNTLPCLLPGTSFFLSIPYAPARKLISEGLPVVLATDYNPGSTPSGNMPFLLSLACIKMKMLPEEAINAVTINGAAALELEHELGSITKGKIANFIKLKPVSSPYLIPYSYGSNLIDEVFIQGHPYSRTMLMG